MVTEPFPQALVPRSAPEGETALPALIPYVTAGYPVLGVTADLLLAAQACACAAAEVGIPFSDPLADGPTVQRSSFIALSNGVTVHTALDDVRSARAQGLSIPLAVMTYINPVLAYGLDAFAADAADVGVDGVIVPDLPFDEAAPIRDALWARGLALIPLVAPTTTPDRLRQICASARGFVYCVGVTGVTGARAELSSEALALLESVREATALPRALGFGLATHEHLRALSGHCEAAVVGSALIDALQRSPHDPVNTATTFLTAMLAGSGSGAPQP